MKISTNSRYALRFLARLAGSNGRMTTAAVAKAEGISEKMLERIAAKLGHEGFVKSIKGIGGGYELSRPPGEITVGMVLHTMETPYLPLHCVEDYRRCPMPDECAILALMKCIDEAIGSVTDSVSIAQLVRGQLSGAQDEGSPDRVR